jgi:hypothetical protein
MTGILGLSIFGYILRLCSSVLENRRYFIYDMFLMISKIQLWVWSDLHFNKNIN